MAVAAAAAASASSPIAEGLNRFGTEGDLRYSLSRTGNKPLAPSSEERVALSFRIHGNRGQDYDPDRANQLGSVVFNWKGKEIQIVYGNSCIKTDAPGLGEEEQQKA